jgi:hypothetical protein
MPTVNEIISETRALVEEKTASFKSKSALAGEDPNSMPGAEHDKPVDNSMKSPNPEVKEELPPNGTSSSGASEDGKVEEGHTSDATQRAGGPHDSAKEEPAITSDANAGTSTSTVSDQAQKNAGNDLLETIRKAQESEKSAAQPEESKEAAAQESPEGDTPATVASKEASPEDTIELSQDVLSKIAATLLSTEEGHVLVEQGLRKAAGAEAAREAMEFVQKQAEEIEAATQFDAGYKAAEDMINQAIYLQGAQDTQEKMAQEQSFLAGRQTADNTIQKIAQTIQSRRESEKVANELSPEQVQELGKIISAISTKQAMPGGDYAEGEMDGMAEGEMDGMAEGEMDGMAEGEMAGGEADAALAEMGEAPAEDDVSAEEIMAAIEAMVAEGTIPPEAAAAIQEHIQGAGAVMDAGADAGMEYGDGGASEPAEGMEIQASELLKAIQKVQEKA